MPKFDNAQAYIDLLKNLRAGYAEFKKEKESEYRQYPDLDAMEKNLSDLFERYKEDRTEFTEEEKNEIDAYYERIQTSYKAITRKNTVMNLHGRDMLEGFLQKADPQEYDHIQAQKTPVKVNTTGGDYEISRNQINILTGLINFMTLGDQSWAPYKRLNDLYVKIASPGLERRTDGYSTQLGGAHTADHEGYFKAGDASEENKGETVTFGLAEYETTLREMEACLEDYLKCEDIKDNPSIELYTRICLRKIRSILSGDPVIDADLADLSHYSIQGAPVNFGDVGDLNARIAAQAGVKGALWLKLVELDDDTHHKLLGAMKLENRDPASPEQEALRQELIMAYHAKKELLSAQTEAFKNPQDPNYQNINPFFRKGMKDNLHNTMDLVGPRGIANTGDTSKIIEVLEAGWPLQETLTCRQLLAYRDVIRKSLARPDQRIQKNQSAEFVQTLEEMADYLDENVKKAYKSPENFRAFVADFATLQNKLQTMPVNPDPDYSVIYENITSVATSGSKTSADNFVNKLQELSREATLSMTDKQLQDSLWQEITVASHAFEKLHTDMNANTRKVWFGSGEYDRINRGMKELSKEVLEIHQSTIDYEGLDREKMARVKEKITACKTDVENYIQRKRGKGLTEIEAERLHLAIQAKERLERLEKAFGLQDIVDQREQNLLDERQQANNARNQAINGENPDWDIVAEEVQNRINNKVNSALTQVLNLEADDNAIQNEKARANRQNLRNNIRNVCDRGLEVMKNVAQRIDQQNPESGKVPLTSEEAKDLCVYTYLHGVTSIMSTAQNVKTFNYDKNVIQQLCTRNFIKTVRAGAENTPFYQELMSQGIGKQDMRNMAIHAEDVKKITDQVMGSIKDLLKEKKKVKAPQEVQNNMEKKVGEPQVKNPEEQQIQPPAGPGMGAQ
jgi:hypothetical protein